MPENARGNIGACLFEIREAAFGVAEVGVCSSCPSTAAAREGVGFMVRGIGQNHLSKSASYISLKPLRLRMLVAKS